MCGQSLSAPRQLLLLEAPPNEPNKLSRRALDCTMMQCNAAVQGQQPTMQPMRGSFPVLYVSMVQYGLLAKDASFRFRFLFLLLRCGFGFQRTLNCSCRVCAAMPVLLLSSPSPTRTPPMFLLLLVIIL
jgi:hypothetical protein